MNCNLCHGLRFRRLPFHYMWEGGRFQGVRCRTCGLVTLDPLPTDEQLVRLYDADYFADGLHGLDRMGTDYETHADAALAGARRYLRETILPRRPGARSVFELGGAMGHFLRAAAAEGLRTGGVEISAAAVERAREKFGIELECGNIEKIDVEPWAGDWDVVYAGDLFEHLRDPSGVLAKVARLLTPGGICVMRVPGTYNLLSTKLGEAVLRLAGRDRPLPDAPYHLYEYTDTTLRRMFAPHFAEVEILCEATAPGGLNLKDRSGAYLAKYALQFINAPLTRLTGRFGDRMTVFARKSD